MPQEDILIRSADLPTFTPAGGTLRMLAGEDHGLGMTLVVAEYPPGADLPAHRHSKGSAIVVIEGHGVFTVGDSEVEAGPSDIVVIPANTGSTSSTRPARSGAGSRSRRRTPRSC